MINAILINIMQGNCTTNDYSSLLELSLSSSLSLPFSSSSTFLGGGWLGAWFLPLPPPPPPPPLPPPPSPPPPHPFLLLLNLTSSKFAMPANFWPEVRVLRSLATLRVMTYIELNCQCMPPLHWTNSSVGTSQRLVTRLPMYSWLRVSTWGTVR